MGIRELLAEDGKKQGFKQGVIQERERQFQYWSSLIKKAIAKGKFSFSEIAELFEVKETFVVELAAQMDLVNP